MNLGGYDLLLSVVALETFNSFHNGTSLGKLNYDNNLNYVASVFFKLLVNNTDITYCKHVLQ